MSASSLVHVDQLDIVDLAIPTVFVPTSEDAPWIGDLQPVAPPEFTVRYDHTTDPLSLFIDVASRTLLPSHLNGNRPSYLCIILAEAEVLLTNEFVVKRWEGRLDEQAGVVERAIAAQSRVERAMDRTNKLNFARSELLKTYVDPQPTPIAPVIPATETIVLSGPGTAIHLPSSTALPSCDSEPPKPASVPQTRVNPGLSTLCAIASTHTAHVPIGRKFAPSCAALTAAAVNLGLIPPISDENLTPQPTLKRSRDALEASPADAVDDASNGSDSGRDTPLNLPPEYLV
jgi:hypothetical protein